MMEFVGKSVRKEVNGGGFITGTVKSYDPSSGFVEIVYEDGDSEELEKNEVVPMLEGAQPELAKAKPRVGRKPKKRRRMERKARAGASSGNGSENLVSDGSEFGVNSGGNCSGGEGNLGLENNGELGFGVGNGDGGNQVGYVNGSVEAIESDGTVGREIGVDGNLNKGVIAVNGDCVRDGGIDLNAGINLNEDFNLNDDSDLLPVEGTKVGLRRVDCIDLNLDVNNEGDASLSGDGLGGGKFQRECIFDLNADVCEEVKEAQGGDADGNGCNEADAVVGKVGGLPLGDVANVDQRSVEGDGVHSGGLNEACDVNDLEVDHVYAKHEASDASLCLIEGKEGDNNRGDADSLQLSNTVSVVAQQMDSPSKAGLGLTYVVQDEPGSSCKQGYGRRKRRKISENLKTTSETGLRRSARWSARKLASSTTVTQVEDDAMLVEPSTATEENPLISGCEQHEQKSALQLKLQFPPSSLNLNLDDVPVLDLFSIYACLRSFSTLLFLSPFELEDLVVALKSDTPSILFDSIHVSILETLRKHLEYLSNEGCKSASDCLRNLNWDFLDLLTWPIFMAEYLLIHDSGFKPPFNLKHSMFSTDYYKQPASVKVQILQHLCDDMIETESIRSELNRRLLVTENGMGIDQSMFVNINNKRRAVTDLSGGSCMTEEIVDDETDQNSDDCCLCKMDGKLICCDGCPAAFHYKCVGVVADSLPEGDWFCPECAIGTHWASIKSLRGGDLIRTDIHGHHYFNTCGYLLVFDSSDTRSLINFYHRNDLHAVVDVLKLMGTPYQGVLMAIYKHWDIPANSSVEASNLVGFNQSSHKNMPMKGGFSAVQTSLAPLTSSETCLENNRVNNKRKLEENSTIDCCTRPGQEFKKSGNHLDSTTTIESPCVVSEGSANTTQARSGIENVQMNGFHDSNRSDESLNQSVVAEKCHPDGDSSLASSSLEVGCKMNLRSVDASCAPLTDDKTISEGPFGIDYGNYYSFARTASLVAEELTCKPPEKINKNLAMSEEDIISDQVKAIMKKSTDFYWPSIQNLNAASLKEKCWWCFSCKLVNDTRDCLFNSVMKRVWEVSESTFDGLQLRKIQNGHLRSIICHILSLEVRLRGLLLGPWLNSHQTSAWHKDLMKTTDLIPVKRLLLLLESNLRPLALSADWLKHVDSINTMGSATHIVVNSRTRHGIGKKRARYSDVEPNSSSNTASGLGIYWWRGGKLSRQLFNCKNLPHSLVTKAARQGGCSKIPGILYPENSDYARRSKYVAWRAAVEGSTSLEQLALQARELYSNIKWRDIENNHPYYVLDKESRKSFRLFKKAIVRRKCTEGKSAKYLIDFGKRRGIPDIVMRHGSLLEESSSERKKYWLDESYVPLHLLKNFEEKRVVRKSVAKKPGKILEIGRVNNKGLHQRGFAYLFSRMENSDCYSCGHCNKDVPTRDVVSCIYCKGYFHKRHARKFSGTRTASAKFYYLCHRCHGGTHVKTNTNRRKVITKLQKVQSQKCKHVPSFCKSVNTKGNKRALSKARKVRSRTNNIPSVPLRRSTRKTKSLYMHNQLNGGRIKGNQGNTNGGRKRGRPSKSRKVNNQKPREVTAQRNKFVVTTARKKRSNICSSYWLNGLWLSRKLNDEQVLLFRDNKRVISSENFSAALEHPKCCLCSGDGCTLNYIACEICGDWFHEDAFGLTVEKSNQLIGFKCHVCLGRAAPICPHMNSKALPLTECNAATECAEKLSNPESLQPDFD